MIINRADWPRLSELLDQALDLTGEERTAWLAQLVNEDRALSGPLRDLLAQSAAVETRDALDVPPDFTGALLAEAERRKSAGEELTPNGIVGSYRLIRELGAGGMGAVWLAERIDGKLKRQVALKFPYAGPYQRQLAERIVRERDILASLEHPNIARLYDADVMASGSPFLVLEYIAGVPINEFCEQQRLSVRDRLALFLQVLNAVQYAHARLVIHRDIKPSNILITTDGVAHLLDFGVAKLIPEGLAKATALTHFTGRALTPDYASPEQITGGVITTASDIYSLGVVLYELLVGARPYRLKRDSRASLEDAIAEADAVVPSRAILVDANAADANAADAKATAKKRAAQLRGDLDAILTMALRKDTADRYATVQAFQDDLLRFLGHEPVLATRGASWYRARKFIRRHRAGVVVAALFLITLIVGAAGIAIAARNAALERDRALRELTYTEASNELMSFILSEAGDKPFTTAELLDRAAQSVGKQFADDADLRARLQLVVGGQYMDVRKFPEALAALLQSQTSARSGNDPSLQIEIGCLLANVYAATGKIDQAKRAYEEVASRLKTIPDLDSTVASTCYVLLSVYHRDRGETAEAIASGEAAVAYLGTPRPGQRSAAITANQTLADAYAMSGRRAEAIKIYEEEIHELEKLGREHTISTLSLWLNYAIHLSRAGQTHRAAEVYQQTLDREAANGRIPTSTLETTYAAVLVWLGRYDEASVLIERAKKTAEASGNPRPIANSYATAANLHCLQGDLQRCAAELARAKETMTPLYPPNHRNFAFLELTAAELSIARNDPDGAREHLRRSLAIFEASTEKEYSRIRSQVLLARTELRLGDRHAALEHATRAVADARDMSRGFASTEWLGIALLCQGIVQKELGDVKSARTTLSAALQQLQSAMGADAPPSKEARTLLAEF